MGNCWYHAPFHNNRLFLHIGTPSPGDVRVSRLSSGILLEITGFRDIEDNIAEKSVFILENERGYD